MPKARRKVHEWKTKFGSYILYEVNDQAGTFARDPYYVSKKAVGKPGYFQLDMGALEPVDAQSILSEFAKLAEASL